MTENLKLMIERKKLMRNGGEEAETKADEILSRVLENGGLTTEEIYQLMAY